VAATDLVTNETVKCKAADVRITFETWSGPTELSSDLVK
jgi:hypothetical protein